MPRLDPKVIRRKILEMAYRGQSVHIPCAFSIVEILCSLYNDAMKEGDKLVLSKGHGVMALYACLNAQGLVPDSDLHNYFKDGSRLHGLAEAGICEASTGSLGHGLPIAVGMAYAMKRDGKASQVYCIVGDGEMQEGTCYEALLFAAHHDLKTHLHVIVDANQYQAMGKSEDILRNTTRFEFPIDVRHTTKGRGVSFMENDNSWHYTRLTNETYERALAELA